PLKRKLLGFRYRGRRDRLYALLGRLWDAGDESGPTLLGRARSVAKGLGDVSREELLQQIPHWMFTFTGSGSDLLGRTLALVTARAEVHRRVLEEIGEAGDLADPATVDGLPYLDACLREAGRLFPPVTRTFHHPVGSRGAPAAADGGAELVHYFPLLQRDPSLGASVHTFRPERWLAPELDAPAAASNLFLRGPRACPGEDLILFVCRVAIARQLGELGMDVRPSRLSRDPLPVSFPAGEAHFITQEAS
ncbi:MAG TPA: cytochrome P450, partial [Longimicrobiales bacterium]|nr:cytochrome P450 [Longimicrobiales bacterium]